MFICVCMGIRMIVRRFGHKRVWTTFTSGSLTYANSSAVDLTKMLSSIVKAQIRIDNTPCEELPSPVGSVADILTSLNACVDAISHTNALSIISNCGKLKIYDSELFGKLRLNLETEKDVLCVVVAMNRLGLCFFHQEIEEWFVAHPHVFGDLSEFWFPLCEFFLRNKDNCFIAKFIQAVGTVIADEKLSLDEALRVIMYLGRYSPNVETKQVVHAIIRKTLNFEIRSVADLNILLKLFFSLSELNCFDDFFIRRRLVPTIYHVYKSVPDHTPQEIASMLAMLDQLPFGNEIVTNLYAIVKSDFKKMDQNNKFYHMCKHLVET